MLLQSHVTIIFLIFWISSLHAMHSPPAPRRTPPSLSYLASRALALIIADVESPFYKKTVDALCRMPSTASLTSRFLKELDAATVKDALALKLLTCVHTLRPNTSAAHVYFKDNATLISDFLTPTGSLGVQQWDTISGKLHLIYLNGTGLRAGDIQTRSYIKFPEGDKSTTLEIWDGSINTKISTFKGHTAPITCVAFSPNKEMLVSASRDHTIKVWDVKTHGALNTLTGHHAPVTHIEFDQYSRDLLASCSEDKTVKLWKLQHGTLLRNFSFSEEIRSLAFSPSFPFMALGSVTGTINLINYDTQELVKSLTEHTKAVTWLTFNAKGISLASVSDDTTIKLWSTPAALIKAIKKLQPAEIVVLLYGMRNHQLYKTIDPLIKTAW